jgi:hypothetical protein
MGPFTPTRVALLAALVRLLGALSPGYIHPDEVFQSVEVVLAAFGSVVLPPSSPGGGVAAHVPWEFANCSTPYRSIVPP